MIRYALPLLALALSGSAQATSLVFTDRAAWEAAATGTIYTETFDSIPDQQTASFVGGTLHTPMFDIVIGTDSHGGAISGGRFHGDVHPATQLGQQGFNEIVFDSPVTAFAADVLHVEETPFGPLSLPLTIGDEAFFYTPPTLGGFFGVMSDTPFSSVLIQLVSGGQAPRFYTLDNVSLIPVPEPKLGALAMAALLLATAAKGRCR